jgi:hypothetical protein
MKDDLNDEMPNGTPKSFPFDGVLTWDGVSKLGGRLERDHPTHFLSWIERSIAQNLV